MQDGRPRSAVRQVERPGGPPQPSRRPAPRADAVPPRRRQLRRLPPGAPPGPGRDELRRLPPGAPPGPGRDLAPGAVGPALRRSARRLVAWARALGKPPERYGPGRLLVREEPLLPPVVWITVALAVTVIASLFAGLVLSTRGGAGTPATSAVTVRSAGGQAADGGRNAAADGGAGANTSEAAAATPAGTQPAPGTPGDPDGAGSTGGPEGEPGDAADPSTDDDADSNPEPNPEPSPEPTPEIPPPPTLALGSAGDDVARLQADLARLGLYGGPVTGSYDQATADSVRTFQGSVGGTGDPDGVFGPPTRGALQAVVLSRG